MRNYITALECGIERLADPPLSLRLVREIYGKPPEPAPGKELHTHIATTHRETVVVLALDERELALLEVLPTRGRSRPLARRCGHDLETLKRWQGGLRLKLRLAVSRAGRSQS